MAQIIKPIEILAQTLIGKKLQHKNTHYRTVELEIESVKVEHHHRQITEDTSQNDWYGESADWDMIKLTFVDGSSREVSLSEELKIVQ